MNIMCPSVVKKGFPSPHAACFLTHEYGGIDGPTCPIKKGESVCAKPLESKVHSRDSKNGVFNSRTGLRKVLVRITWMDSSFTK